MPLFLYRMKYDSEHILQSGFSVWIFKINTSLALIHSRIFLLWVSVWTSLSQESMTREDYEVDGQDAPRTTTHHKE